MPHQFILLPSESPMLHPKNLIQHDLINLLQFTPQISPSSAKHKTSEMPPSQLQPTDLSAWRNPPRSLLDIFLEFLHDLVESRVSLLSLISDITGGAIPEVS